MPLTAIAADTARVSGIAVRTWTRPTSRPVVVRRPAQEVRPPAEPECGKGDKDATILRHLSLVKAIAARIMDTLPVNVEFDDLVHAGVLGLIDAVKKFDDDKNVAFATYAKHRIRGAILDSLRQLDWASRDMRRRHRMMEEAVRELSAELGRYPSEEEIANRLGLDLDRWRQIAVTMQVTGLVSADSRQTDHEDGPTPEYAGRNDVNPDVLCIQEQRRAALDKVMSVLPPRYRRVIQLYYDAEKTMKEIGQEMGINESRVSQIHKAALEKLNNAFLESGVTSAAAFSV
jgi:RNA polymerase sigma factor for flagellar operon FliA